MGSQARRMRRAQARQIAKQLTRPPKMQQATASSAPSPAEVPVAERLAHQGVELRKSLLWTPGRQ